HVSQCAPRARSSSRPNPSATVHPRSSGAVADAGQPDVVVTLAAPQSVTQPGPPVVGEPGQHVVEVDLVLGTDLLGLVVQDDLGVEVAHPVVGDPGHLL